MQRRLCIGFSMLQIYDGVILFIIIINGFSSLLPWASWRSTDQYYPAFITKHSTLLPVMMTENSSWSSREFFTIITLSWRKISIVTHSTSSWHNSLAIPCNDDGALSNVILSRLSNHYSYLVFTLSRWQSNQHCYIFMITSYSYFVLPTNFQILLPDKSHWKHHSKLYSIVAHSYDTLTQTANET
jgi:hypothetical protein